MCINDYISDYMLYVQTGTECNSTFNIKYIFNIVIYFRPVTVQNKIVKEVMEIQTSPNVSLQF